MSVVFLGTSDFAVPSLKLLVESGIDVHCVVTQPDRKKDRGKQLKGTPVKDAALALGLPVYQPENVNVQEAIDYLKAFEPDFLVVIAYGQILSEAVLEIPKIAPLNVHGSLLPSYRGAAPIERAVMAGEAKSGVTLIKVVKALDAGDMYLKKEVTITEDMTSGDLENELKILGGKLLVEGIKGIKKGILVGEPQDDLKATYAHKIKKEDRYISFEASGRIIVDLIRGLQPRTFALAFFRGNPLGICEGFYEPDASGGKPGEIIKIDKKKGILVQCRVGGFYITKVKPQGKKIMDFKAYINGNPIQLGEVLE